MTQQNKDLVHRYFDELLSKGKLTAMGEVLAPDVVVYPPAYMGQPLRGQEAVRGWFVALRNAFPDFNFTVGEEVVEGDRVASAFRMTGTHRAAYMGIPASGKTVDLKGADIFRFKNGRISEVEIYYDTLGLMTQLGVIPAQQPAPTR